MDNFENKEVEQQPEVMDNRENEAIEEAVTEQLHTEEFATVYNPITVGEIVPEKSNKASLGLKVFALIMAMVILTATACITGYYIGKSNGVFKPKVNVNLASKPAKTDEMTAAQVYDKVSDSVVGIIVYNASGAASYASGVIYSQDGYVVTNDHIYSSVAAPKFKVYTQDGKEYDAVYVAGDVVSDLAVLKIKGNGFKAATFGNSDEIIYGENVVAIGCPSEPTEKASITRGIVSAVDRRVQTTSSYSARLIQTDSPINPGSSGGALVNMYGQVIGITSAKVVSSDQEAVGYAIPTTTMKYIVEELIKEGKVISRAKLGISYYAVTNIEVELRKYKYVGLLVDSVAEDSDLYGKLKKGDTIVQINGVNTDDDAVVLNIIEQSRAGDIITVTFVTESGESKTLKATLRANIGESSYQADINRLPQNPDGNKDFNFPEGE
ncbi:MAG: serine protease [Clostridia bacterium]|nr:serine protease [Clostridia bacterium]